ncbi:SPW repeat domain-containing protein [Maribacter sp. 2-571]|uniref:SPW repeat domain-containing protein n=1 Tax=Maribacter sp. 2-571 TaxID=3417569 RepID=UPI003D344DFC
MKFVTKRIHAFLDYPVAIALMVLPFLLGLGGTNSMALYLSLIVGIAAFVLTVLTDHHLGIVRVVPYKMHLTVDFLVAVLFVIAPFIFSFQGIDAYYYWVNGIAVLTVVSLHKPEAVAA